MRSATGNGIFNVHGLKIMSLFFLHNKWSGGRHYGIPPLGLLMLVAA